MKRKSPEPIVETNPLILIDSVYEKSEITNNFDSLYRLAKINISKKRYLEAYKYLYWAKGVLSIDPSKDSAVLRTINKDIRTTTIEINSLIRRPPTETFFEETKSIKISDEKIDSTD